MSRARVVASWDPAWQRQHRVPQGSIVLRIDPRYRNAFRKFLRAVDERNRKRRERLTDAPREPGDADLAELEVTFELWHRKRTLDQNALMWSLYSILANEQNGNTAGATDQMVTADELYQQDMREIAPVIPVEARAEHVEAIRQIAAVKKVEAIPGTTAMVLVWIIETSSVWNTVRMAKHIETLFNRLAYFGTGIESGADVAAYWMRWRQFLNDQKVSLYGLDMTEAEYREATPWCEACGEFVGNGAGHLDHIRTRGAALGDERRKAADWLHLCPLHHVFGGSESKHQGGVDSFVKQFPHLRDKIESALRRGKDGQDEGTVTAAEAVQGGRVGDGRDAGDAERAVGVPPG